MSDPDPRVARVPWWVSTFSPVLKPLLKAGVPMGLNGLVTIRGRTSGQPRTTPLAIVERGGRQWVWSPWGDVHWVRTLRAAGEATVTVRRRSRDMTATELDPDERIAFFRDVMEPIARGVPLGMTFVRVVDQVDLSDPVAAADGRAVFELRPAA